MAPLLEHALEVVASQGPDTERVNLHNLNYTGCTGCFACKLKGRKSYGKCAVQDGMTPILEKIPDTDAPVSYL